MVDFNGRLTGAQCADSARRVRAGARRRTGQWTVIVRCTTELSGGPGCQSSNDRTLRVGWRGWRRCAHRQQPNPNGWFGGWGYKYPQPPPLQGIQVFSHCIQYKSSRLHSKTQNKRSNPLQVPNSFQRLSGLWERDICVHLSSYRLDRFSSSSILVLKQIVIKQETPSCGGPCKGSKWPVD
jgi:hypothetical protein